MKVNIANNANITHIAIIPMGVDAIDRKDILTAKFESQFAAVARLAAVLRSYRGTISDTITQGATPMPILKHAIYTKINIRIAHCPYEIF